jgi:hypothetical protein
MRSVALAVLVVLCALPAVAGDEGPNTGRVILEVCQTAVAVMDNPRGIYSADEAMNAGQCIGNINGFFDFYHVGLTAGWIAGTARFCTPNGATNEQYLRIVVKYLKANPEKLHQNGTWLIYQALREAFPCPA